MQITQMAHYLEFYQQTTDDRGVPVGILFDQEGESIIPYNGYVTLLEAEYMASLLKIELYEL